jgi:hypothetical protein
MVTLCRLNGKTIYPSKYRTMNRPKSIKMPITDKFSSQHNFPSYGTSSYNPLWDTRSEKEFFGDLEVIG